MDKQNWFESSNAAWDASGTEIDPCVVQIIMRRFGHENISTTTFPLLLIQEKQYCCQLMTKECTLSTCKLHASVRLAQEQCG